MIPLTVLYEVVRPPHRFALLPATPQWMPGVVAWRGETIAAIDLSAYLSHHPAEHPNEGILLIANLAGLALGLLVSSIEQAVLLQTEETAILGDEATGALNRPSTGAADRIPGWCLPERAAFVKSMQGEALVLNVPLLLTDVVQQIGTAASHG